MTLTKCQGESTHMAQGNIHPEENAGKFEVWWQDTMGPTTAGDHPLRKENYQQCPSSPNSRNFNISNFI